LKKKGRRDRSRDRYERYCTKEVKRRIMIAIEEDQNGDFWSLLVDLYT
jgi:hypothetical protein